MNMLRVYLAELWSSLQHNELLQLPADTSQSQSISAVLASPPRLNLYVLLLLQEVEAIWV